MIERLALSVRNEACAREIDSHEGLTWRNRPVNMAGNMNASRYTTKVGKPVRRQLRTER
jgi:hypothetical protein